MTDTAQPAAYAKPKSTVVPYLTVDGAARPAEFYKRALGAEVAAMHPVDDQGRTMHVHLYINGGSVMLSDAYPDHGHPFKEPAGFNVSLQVDDADAWWKRAVEAGATGVQPVSEMFWGDRFGIFKDPFGVIWTLNQPKAA
ncbi:MAG TPA: glyoxalase/bleomycin resistance/extradiol dioxygenase family protein [Caulobacteraceae bacterium]